MALQVWFDEKYQGAFNGNVISVNGTQESGVTSEDVIIRKKAVTLVDANANTDVSGLDHYASSDGKTLAGSVSGEGDSYISNYFSFDVNGAWNTVKNARATSEKAEHLTFKDFVHVHVSVGDTYAGGGYAASDIFIENAKRAFVHTGSGDDSIAISTVTNRVDIDKNGSANSWYVVEAGAGADTITFNKGSVDGANDGAKGSLTLTNGNGTTDGHFSSADIDLGEDDKASDIVNFNGVHFKHAYIDHYVAGQDHIYVNGTEVTLSSHPVWLDF